jgi:hypothetical protein
MDSLLLLHMQHQSTTITFFFLKLSKVKVFPRVIVCTKKLTLDGTSTLQMVFRGNYELDGVDSV